MSRDGPEEQSKPGRPPLRFSCASESDANVSTQRFAELSLSGRRKFSLQPFSFSDVLAATENKFSPDDLEGIEEDRRGLFIDFDETIVNGHWHNEIMNDFVLGSQETEDQFKALMKKHGLKRPNEMCNLIRDALNNEHHVAVLTASKYIKLVSLALESMGLTQEEIRKIYVKNGPEKNLLIQEAKTHFKIRNYRSILLLDDAVENCEAAEKIGCQAVLVSSENNYFEKAGAFVEQQEKRNKLKFG